MSTKKALIGLAVVGGVIAIASLANAKPAKRKEQQPEEVFPADDSPDPTQITEEETDVVLIPPGPKGDAGGGPAIVIPTSPDGDVDDAGEPTNVDEHLADLAEQAGKTPEDAIAEVVNEVTQGQGVSPIGKEETSKALDPYGTVALARKMLARETMPGWKSDLKGDVRVWQMAVGFTGADVDGEFGLKSAARMAEEVGILPLIRTWNKRITTKAQAEREYDQLLGNVIHGLRADLPDSQPQIDALIISMSREQAQSFGSSNPPIQPTLEVAQLITDHIAATAEKQGQEDLKNV